MRFAAFRRPCRFVVPSLATSLVVISFPSIATAGTCRNADRVSTDFGT